MARTSSITARQKEAYAAKIAAGGETYESVSKKIGITRAGAYKILSPLVEELRGSAGAVNEKIHDAVQSINSLPAPLKKASVGLLETMLTALDGDFAEYMKNSTKIALHTSKLAMRRLSEAGANPTAQDLAQVGMLTKIGRENGSVVLDAARVMGEAAKPQQKSSETAVTKITLVPVSTGGGNGG